MHFRTEKAWYYYGKFGDHLLDEAESHFQMVCQQLDSTTDRGERKLIDKEKTERYVDGWMHGCIDGWMDGLANGFSTTG